MLFAERCRKTRTKAAQRSCHGRKSNSYGGRVEPRKKGNGGGCHICGELTGAKCTRRIDAKTPAVTPFGITQK